jgi:glycine/D-amino acid oxidase-like deaminating enzyme
VSSLPDVVVIGAGVIGAACAYYAARAGLTVTVVDAGSIAGGTTGAGEGNLLVSDKEPGPELELATRSLALWEELANDPATRLGPAPGIPEGVDFEYERKGGLVVASSPDALEGLHDLADRQKSYGVEVERIDGSALADVEPGIARDLAGGVFYPQDAQVQPMLAAALLLRAARLAGATVQTGVRVTGIRKTTGDVIKGVITTAGEIATPAVVNAAGPWGCEVAALADAWVPILPRRGFILVTEPQPPGRVRHKVYTADYMANVASSSAGLETSAVVESTKSGTILIGASRERVGFDRSLSVPVLRKLAAQAVRLFPFLAQVSAMRAYRGFRPYTPDHLPVIGPDPRVDGLFHACGHEGAGIGLAPATGALVAEALTGGDPDLGPFRPDRFAS